jgi:DNA-binding response OmpR family regulator
MGNPLLILFADRDSHSRMRQLLEQAGYAVATCQIEVVRDTAAQLQPLVIVIDAQLLVGAHAGLLDLLRLSSTATIPIVLTSKGKQENRAPGSEGFQIFSRPVDREKLFLAINAYDVQASGGVPPVAS